MPTRRTFSKSSLEPLEARIAPAAVVPAAPELRISVVDDIADSPAGSAPRGGTIHYTITYENVGTAIAEDVTIEDTLGLFTTFDAADSPGWKLDVFSGRPYIYLGDLAPGAGPMTVQLAVELSPQIPSAVKTVSTALTIQETVLITATPQPPKPPIFVINPIIVPTSGPEEGETSRPLASASATLMTPVYQGIYVAAPGVARQGEFPPPVLRVFDIATAQERTITAYEGKFRDSVRTAVADFNGDGFDDVLVVSAKGKGAVKVFNGVSGEELSTPFTGLQPFGKKAGAFVAIGVATGEGGGDALVAPGSTVESVVFGSSLGGGAIAIYDGTGAQVDETFFPFGQQFKGGVRVAIADIDADGRNDLVAAQGNYGNQVQVYSNLRPELLVNAFNVGGAKYQGGLNIAVAADAETGIAQIVTGRNRLSSPIVEVFAVQRGETPGSGSSVFKLTEFTAFAKNYKGGVRVALADVDLDGALDVIAATGYAGQSQVRIFDGSTLQPTLPTLAAAAAGPHLMAEFTAYPDHPLAAVWLAATTAMPSVVAGPRPG